MPITQRLSSNTISPKSQQSSTYESVAQSNQCGSSEQIIHTETRCVTETMVRLEHKSPQPDSQTDLQLLNSVPSAKSVESNACAINGNRSSSYTHHQTYPNQFKHDESDSSYTKNDFSQEIRGNSVDASNLIGGIGAKHIVPKEIFLTPTPINDTYQVYQAANVRPLTNDHAQSPATHRTFVSNAANYELKAPALVNSIESLSTTNGKCHDNDTIKNYMETGSTDTWSMHKQQSIKFNVCEEQRKPFEFTPQKHANKPFYHNRFNDTETRHYNNTTPKIDSRHDATPMQAPKKVRTITQICFVRKTKHCMLLAHC